MQLNIEFYSKEEYAIEQNNSDQYPFSSSSDNDLFAFCSFTIRVLQNLEKHPLGKVLAILLKNMDNENIKEIVNHSYLFPGFHDLDEMTRSVGPRLSPAMLLAIDQDILMKYPLQVQYRGRGDKSFYLSMPPFRFKNNGFGIFGKEINYFGFHSVFCFLNYFAKKYSGQDKFTDSLCRIANYSGICKLSDKIPFSDTFNYSNEIFEIVKEEIKKIYINSMQEKEKEEIKKHRLNETIEGLNIKELNEKALTARKLKKYDDAIVAYSKIIELEPSALAYTNRGISYGMLGNYDQEINDYNKAIEIYPSAIAYNNRGFAYAMLGNNNHAIKDYDKAIELNPQLAVAYMNRAAMYQKIKKYEQSMADLKMAAKLGDKETQKLLSEYRIKW